MTTIEPVITMPSERCEIASLPSKEAAVMFAVAHFLETGKAAIEERGMFCVALSGGSTPKSMYEVLADPLVSKHLDWERVLLFWSDERSVPSDHEDSNYNMAMSRLADLPIKKEHIFPMHAASDLEVNAAAYESLIKEKAGGRLDLTMLGMGPDGHTASLFPETKALMVTDKLVVPNYIPKLDTWRMTFTLPCINSSRNIAVYILGESKAEMAIDVLDGDTDYPIKHVGTDKTPALWITDLCLS